MSCFKSNSSKNGTFGCLFCLRAHFRLVLLADPMWAVIGAAVLIIVSATLSKYDLADFG